ncbi:SagB family peptide dehydrogenase [Micromonospora psammae]|uniref:SagB family peptide dehydrogenase n=1 Tax=Micromonospora sp. CPCC 205556 TaxID=3122398 RepID=UPI002FEE9B85
MRTGEVTRLYHHETNQCRDDRPPGVPGFVPMDPSNRPEPFKRHLGAPVHPLPRDLPPTGAPAAATLSGRVPPGDPTIDGELLARLLFYSAGVTRTAGDNLWFRAAPSAGNLHPLEMYAVAGEVAGLDAGLYHFAPEVFGLEALAAGDHRRALADATADPDVAGSPLALIVTGLPWRTAWKYAKRGWRHVYWDAGTMLANLLAVAEGHGLPVRVRLGFVDAAVSRLLGVDGVTEFPVAVITCGRPTATAAAEPVEPPPPQFPPTPLSPAPVDFPLVIRVQQAGELATGDDVTGWRAAAVAGLPRATDTVDAPVAAGSEPIESVILRRGSTRRMRRQLAPAELLHWAMAAATRAVPADAIPSGSTLLSHEVAVHAVHGTEPGLYQRVDGPPQLRRSAPEPEVRTLSQGLCLDQPLGGDSAYTDFACADLDQVLDGYGERGYRVAQFEAGVAAGRLQLAAFALGHGGTGLTFCDQDVSDAFDTRAACMLAVAIGLPAYRPKPGGPPGRPRRITR